MRITLRTGERLFLNGAVIKTDRKVSLELMNDACFLLEAHIMLPDKATSPLRQLYFIVQTMLMSPADTATAKELFDTSVARMLGTYEDAQVLATLRETERLVGTGRHFDALKALRGIFSRDDALMAPSLALAG